MNYLVAKYNNLINKNNMVNANADDWFNPPQPLPPTQQKPNYEEELIRLLKEKGQDVTQEEYDKLLKEYISAKESGYEPPQSTNPIDERQWHSNPHPINPFQQPVKLPVTQEEYDKLLKEYISAKESGYEPPQSTNPIDERQWHSNPHPINPVHQPVKLPVTQEKSIALSGNSRLLENRASMPNYGANRGYQIPFNPFSAQYSQQKPQSMTVNSTRNLLGKKYNNKNLGSKFANKKNYNF